LVHETGIVSDIAKTQGSGCPSLRKGLQRVESSHSRIAIRCGGLFAAVRFSESMRKHAQSGSRYSMLKSTDVSEARRWFAEDLRVSSPVARNPAIVEAFAKETGRHFTS
jgi:hypothetical protein